MNIETRLARLEARARRWQAACVALLVLAAAAATAAVSTRPAVAAEQPSGGFATVLSSVGRYQVVTASRELNPLVIVTDTQTGHTWTADATGGKWIDRGTPAEAEAK